MIFVAKCKCTHDCDEQVSLTIDEDAYVAMLRIHGSMGAASIQLNRQDIVNINAVTGKAVETISPKTKKLFGGAHVQLRLPNIEEYMG